MRIQQSLPERLNWLTRGCDHRSAELIARRKRVKDRARAGDAKALAQLERVKIEQRRLAADKERRLELLRSEPSLVVAGDSEMVAHALVLPTHDRDDKEHHTALVEDIAMRVAQAHEEAMGATVHDVSRPELARKVGLDDWPGFDLMSVHPEGCHRNIEVKGPGPEPVTSSYARTNGLRRAICRIATGCTLSTIAPRPSRDWSGSAIHSPSSLPRHRTSRRTLSQRLPCMRQPRKMNGSTSRGGARHGDAKRNRTTPSPDMVERWRAM